MFRRKPNTPDLPPEWLIVGLGNPGPEYRGTRHNVGFELIDRLADQARVKLDQRKHQSQYGLAQIAETQVLLVKPMTFMNRSGQAVAALKSAYGIPLARILIVADEMDLPVGRVRLKASGGPAGHNGHRSIIQSLGSTEYPRLRIGVGRAEPGQTVDHVLGGFTPSERAEINEALARSERAVEALLRDGIETAMGQSNGSA